MAVTACFTSAPDTGPGPAIERDVLEAAVVLPDAAHLSVNYPRIVPQMKPACK
jgi:hypothetical protein